MTSLQKTEQRTAVDEKMRKLLETATNETRDLSTEERATYSGLESDYDQLSADIEMLERAEARAKELASTPKRTNERRSTPEKKATQTFSILRAIQRKIDGKPLDGIEAEMHQEAEREARASGLSISGIGIPSFMSEKRAGMDAGTDSEGGYSVETSVEGFIDFLNPRLQVEDLGATRLNGLTGNVAIPRQTTAGAIAWEGEIDTTAETTAVLDQVNLTPKRMAAFTTYSKQLLYQSSIGIENFVRMDLTRAQRNGLNIAAINGSGAAGQPTGLLNTGSIGDVAMGTNGLAPTWAALLELETDINTANADMGKLAYLTTPGIRGYLKGKVLDAGSGQFIWGQGSNTLNGYNAVASNHVPSDLDKGTSSGVCHAIIFGNWEELIIANWGGSGNGGFNDITVDPYTLAGNAQIKVIVNSFWDIALRHPASFSAIQDALTA